MNDIFVRKVALPTKVKGTVVVMDGDYIVLINDLLCEETQKEALRHELRHIKGEHLYDEATDVNICEMQAQK